MADTSARPSSTCPWCGTVVASSDDACPNCGRRPDWQAWVVSCHAQAEGLAPPGWEGLTTNEPLDSIANVTGYLRRELAALRILGEIERGEFWLERANELYANIFRALSALRIWDRPEQLPKGTDCDEAERRLDELWRRLAATEGKSAGGIGQPDSGTGIEMAGRSQYTVKSLLLYLADLERREQTARDLPDGGGELDEDPGLLMAADIAVSRRKLREWPDVQRIMVDCEAAGHSFNAAGMNEWVATVCKANEKRPDEVGEWNLDQFCEMAGKSSQTTAKQTGTCGADKPQWESDTGKLIFRGQVVRNLSGQATNARAVLAAFQEQDWRVRIDDPLPGGKNPERLNETVKSLNQNLTGIRFRADGSGAGYRWEPSNDG